MTPLETQIVQLLQQDEHEDPAAIAGRLGCSVAKVKVVAGKYMVTSAVPGEDRASEAKRRRETRAYHVTSVLSAAESRKYMDLMPKQVSLQGKDGGRLTLVMDYQSALLRRDENAED